MDSYVSSLSFVAVDVETANSDVSSICQVGVAIFEGGELRDTWQTLVNPKSSFDGMNVSIHGITEKHVRKAPVFKTIAPKLRDLLEGRVVVSHTAFDRSSLTRAHEEAGLTAPTWEWLDSAKVVRRTWPQFSRRGYGLAPVAEHLKIKFEHHDALEDARASGEILLACAHEHKLPLPDIVKLSKRRIPFSEPKLAAQTPRELGSLSGEVVVFTGSLNTSRMEAANQAGLAGATVANNVTKKTTVLVVGDQDLLRTNGEEKSGKHRKAEEYKARGQAIEIIGEAEFQRLVEVAPKPRKSSPKPKPQTAARPAKEAPPRARQPVYLDASSGPVIEDAREVGPGLGLGIVVFPYIFAWFLLKKGYSAKARVLAFLWMGWVVWTAMG